MTARLLLTAPHHQAHPETFQPKKCDEEQQMALQFCLRHCWTIAGVYTTCYVAAALPPTSQNVLNVGQAIPPSVAHLLDEILYSCSKLHHRANVIFILFYFFAVSVTGDAPSALSISVMPVCNVQVMVMHAADSRAIPTQLCINCQEQLLCKMQHELHRKTRQQFMSSHILSAWSSKVLAANQPDGVLCLCIIHIFWPASFNMADGLVGKDDCYRVCFMF
jgi:hypothetical protein